MKFIYFSFILSLALFPIDKNIYFKNQFTEKNLNSIEQDFLKSDVLVIGEEHDDKIGHQFKLELIQFLSSKNDMSISMEMFETDQQIVLNEYLNGFIDEKTFLTNIKLWNNYEDYKPIIELAKEKKIPVIAANAPRRYVRILSRKGFSELEKLPLESKKYLPSLYMIESFRDINYEKKISESISAHGKMSEQSLNQMILAQHLWDASMSEQIYKQKQNKKIIHINGRFHSDNKMGVVFRLEKMGLKVLTISLIQNEKDAKSELADYVIITSNTPAKQ